MSTQIAHRPHRFTLRSAVLALVGAALAVGAGYGVAALIVDDSATGPDVVDIAPGNLGEFADDRREPFPPGVFDYQGSSDAGVIAPGDAPTGEFADDRREPLPPAVFDGP